MLDNIVKKKRGRMQTANVPNSALQRRYRSLGAPPTQLSLRHHEYNYEKEATQVYLKNIPLYP